LEELNNLNLGGDVYLALFSLIRAHSIVCIDGNKLKNERKCTPCIEKMTENRHHGGQKGIHWWGIYYSEELTSTIAGTALK